MPDSIKGQFDINEIFKYVLLAFSVLLYQCSVVEDCSAVLIPAENPANTTFYSKIALNIFLKRKNLIVSKLQ